MTDEGATLSFDLPTEAEVTERSWVFDVPPLGERVSEAIDRVRSRPELARLPGCAVVFELGGPLGEALDRRAA